MGRHSAERIVPELQHIEVGDLVPLGPGENAGMRVQEFVPNTSILLWDEKNQTRVVPRLAGANQRNVAASEPSLGGPRGFTEVPRLGAMSSPDWRRQECARLLDTAFGIVPIGSGASYGRVKFGPCGRRMTRCLSGRTGWGGAVKTPFGLLPRPGHAGALKQNEAAVAASFRAFAGPPS